MIPIAVVGLGPAGCLFVANLPPERRRDVSIFSPKACVGGDLAEKYGEVHANLTRSQMERAFRAVPEWRDASLAILDAFPADVCPPLGEICRQLGVLMEPLLEQVSQRVCTSIQTIRQRLPFGWELTDGEGSMWVAQKVVVCTGADPRVMEIPKTVIPLDVALSPTRLKAFFSAGAGVGGVAATKVVVFGTSHSGTLVLKNLRDAGCSQVVGIYKGARPFVLFRYGHTEGLKQEAADIADAIEAKSWGDQTPRLLPFADFEKVAVALLEADYVVYAMGFSGRAPVFVDARGQTWKPQHDPDTGLIAPNCWGFGIGFPGRYRTNTGAWAPDVGFGGFVEAIQKNLQTILN